MVRLVLSGVAEAAACSLLSPPSSFLPHRQPEYLMTLVIVEWKAVVWAPLGRNLAARGSFLGGGHRLYQDILVNELTFFFSQELLYS